MQQEIFHECKSDLSSWPYTTAPSSSARSLLTASDRWQKRDQHLIPEAYVAESTSYLFHDARVECTTSTEEEEEELMRCVGRRPEVDTHTCPQNCFDSNSTHKSLQPFSDFVRPGAGTENQNKNMSPSTSACFCSNNHCVATEESKYCRNGIQAETKPPFETSPEFKHDAPIPQLDVMLQQLTLPQFRDVTADLVVKVGGKSFKAHRFLLAHYSGYFYNLLKERQGKMFVEVTIRDVSPNAFSVLYDWMYSSQLPINSQNLLEVWFAAQILEIPEASRLCVDYMYNLKNSPDDLLNLYFQSKEVGDKSMIEHILRVMASVFSRIIRTTLFTNLDFDGFRSLLACDNLNVNSEKDAFDSVIRWLKDSSDQRRECVIDLMKSIRFGHMSEEELFDTLFSDSSAAIMCYPECRLMVLDGFLSNTSRNLGNVNHFPQLFALPRRYKGDQLEEPVNNQNAVVVKDNGQKCLTINSERALVNAETANSSFFNYPQTSDCLKSPYQNWSKMASFIPFTMPDVCADMSKHEKKFKWWSKMKNPTNALDSSLCAATIQSARTFTAPTDEPSNYSSNANSPPCHPRSPRSPYQSQPYGKAAGSSPCSPLQPPYFQPPCCSPKTSAISSNGATRSQTPSLQSPQGSWANYQPTWENSSRASTNGLSINIEKEEKKKVEYIETSAIIIMGGLNPLESWTVCSAGKLMYTFTSKCVSGRSEGAWKKYDMELPSPRHHAVAVTSCGYVYMSGGCCPSRSRDGRHIEALNTMWRLDVRNKRWDRMCDMIHARIHHGFVALNKVLIALGGQDESGRLLSSVEMYDIREDKWKEVAHMATPRMGMGAATFRNNVWVCGGMAIKDKEKSPTITKTVECYEASTDRWCVMNPLRFPRCFGTLVECGGFLHLVGGVTRVSTRKDGVISSVASIDIHDYVTDEWSFKAALQVPRHSAAAATLDHHLYVIGGITSLEACALDCVECFNDVKGCWDKTPVHLPMPLSGVCCVVVNIQIEDE